MKLPEDETLGKLYSMVVAGLVLCLLYLAILLPFSSSPGTSVTAIGAIAGLLGTIITVKAVRK